MLVKLSAKAADNHVVTGCLITRKIEACMSITLNSHFWVQLGSEGMVMSSHNNMMHNGSQLETVKGRLYSMGWENLVLCQSLCSGPRLPSAVLPLNGHIATSCR